MEDKTKKRTRHPDRVTLTPTHLVRIDSWIEQVRTLAKGVRISRNQLVQWLIEQHSEELPDKERRELGQRFYDDERFLRETLREIRVSRSRGELVDLKQLLGSAVGQKTRAVTRQRRPRESTNTQIATSTEIQVPAI